MICVNCGIEMDRIDDTHFYLGKNKSENVIPAALYACSRCERKIRWEKNKGIIIIEEGSKINMSEISENPLDKEEIKIPSIKIRRKF